MSRTKRCQKGDRWWMNERRSKWNFRCGNRSKFFSWGAPAVALTPEEVEANIREYILNYEKKDGYSSKRWTRSVKWHSNVLVRSSNRMQIQKIMKTGEYDSYDPTHDHLKKKLIWCYD